MSTWSGQLSVLWLWSMCFYIRDQRHQHLQGECMGLCVCHQLAHRKLFLCQRRSQSCAAAFSAGGGTEEWVTHLTRSMTRSLGAALTGSSLIITIWSPGISLPSEGPPGEKQEWSAGEKTIANPLVASSPHHDSLGATRATSKNKTQPHLHVLYIRASQPWLHSRENWGALDQPEAQATPWPIKSESSEVGLRNQHFSKTPQARLSLSSSAALRHFSQAPRGCWCCWSTDHTLSMEAPRRRYFPHRWPISCVDALQPKLQQPGHSWTWTKLHVFSCYNQGDGTLWGILWQVNKRVLGRNYGIWPCVMCFGGGFKEAGDCSQEAGVILLWAS